MEVIAVGELACFLLTCLVLRGLWWLFFEPDDKGRVVRVLAGIDALDREQMVKDPPPVPPCGREQIDIDILHKRRN